jgi:hypothetical protein
MSGVEPDDVEHPAVRGVSDAELGGGHAHHDQLRCDPRALPVLDAA